jgi:hypothetical protein
MGEFSSAWLRLREPVDRRSRNSNVAAALPGALGIRGDIRVVDIGCGTGANLRATAPLLGPEQTWTLVDNDMALLTCASETLAAWADTAISVPGGLSLNKNGMKIVVRFRHADVAGDIDHALGRGVDLVTASAFFDLVSQTFIERFVTAVARRNATLYAVLTYNGALDWLPWRAEDARISQAFNTHQQGDKGFGPAAGPRASEILADVCEAAGYRMQVGDSPWDVGRDDHALLRELTDGVAAAVSETGMIDAAALAAWHAHPRYGVLVGHSDILALPPR